MNKPSDDSADTRKARNRAVVNWFCISFLMLIVPAAVLWWHSLRDGLELIPMWLQLAVWGISGVMGLLCGVRSFRLADWKSTGFGILAVFLHICSLLLLGLILVFMNYRVG
jgi:hypothetical protein